MFYVTVTGTSGTFFSPNFPNNYPDDYEEHYIITVEENFQISLYFEYFDIEFHISCLYDNLKGNKRWTFFRIKLLFLF